MLILNNLYHRAAFILLLMVFAIHGNSQTKRQNRPIAIEQIKLLKDGSLMVRLHTRQRSIDAMRKAGKDKQAAKLEQHQKELNQTIADTFNNDFRFCPVYFFSSEYTVPIKNGEWEEVVFLNDSLEADSSITLANTNFLIEEFGYIEQDTIAL